MKDIRQIICISCPIGCPLTVTVEENKVIRVEGQGCKRGEIYAGKECVNPTRIVTSTVMVTDGVVDMVPVKTATDIPKDKIPACMKALRGITVQAPIKMGDVIIENVADTGISVVATRYIPGK